MTTLILRPLPVPQKKYTVQSDNPLKNATDSIVEKVIGPYIQQENIVGVSVGIVDEDRFYTYDYGETEKDGHQLPTENTIYEIGSITKTFTSALLAEMVLQGKCKLSDPVNKYLPANIPMLQKHDTIVTLKMLANHTSGLPRIPSDLFSGKSFVEGDPYKNYDTADLFNYLDTVRLRTTPGIGFSYSNLGFGLLGTILERISGLTYQQLMEKYICNPLKMNDTRTILNEGQQKYFSQGYNERGKPVFHWHFASMAGCGAIRSSVHDMLKYLNAHLAEDDSTNLLKAFQLGEQPTFSIEGRQIGLGWIIPERSPGWYWHNGGTGGFRSYCAINPDKKIAFVILANSSIGVDNEGFALIKALSK
jgi:CubicO group peptidase (beta-lactamase class C family)